MIANPVWIAANTAMNYHVESKDNYYKQEGDLGTWQGKGAKILGLEGAITEKELENALWGKNKDGDQVVNVRLDEKGDRKRAALDLTFNAPKSVSVLLEVANATGNKEYADKIVDIFNQCVSKSLNKFESIVQTRETINGSSNVYASNNLAIAKFTHSISRPIKNKDGSYTVDPSLHTHAVIMNMTKGKDGTFKAIETEKIYQQYMKIGSLFRIDFAHQLNKELGLEIDITNRKQALFEVKLGTEDDSKILDEFSKRSEQINNSQLIEEFRTKYPNKSMNEIKQLVAYATREWKGEIDRKKVETDNLIRSRNVGFGENKLKDIMHKILEPQNHPTATEEHINEDRYINDALMILEEEKSVFSDNDVLEIASKLGFKNLCSMDKIEEAFRKNKQLIKLDNTTYTTKNILNAERDLIDSMDETKKIKQQFLVKEAKLSVQEFSLDKKEETGFGLTDGQANAVIHILSSTEQIIGIQGDAGTGKTTALNALNQLKKDNTKIIGLSYTGKAANEIELKTANASKAVFDESGIESFTIASFLNTHVGDVDNLKQFNDLKIIVDEASMLGTKDAQELVNKAIELKAQLILMGDEKQFKAIGAGDPFALLKDHANMKTINMKESIRQKDPLLKRVVKKLNNFDSNSAFDMLDSSGNIHQTEHGINALIDAYFETPMTKLAIISGQDTLKNNVILTNVNTVKDELNKGIRERSMQEGLLQTEGTKLDVRKSANLRPIEHFFAESYHTSKATHIFVQDEFDNMERGQEFKISKINTQNDTLTVYDSKGKHHLIDLNKHGKHIQAYIEEEKHFTENERVIFLKNDKKLGVNNGEMGTIKALDKNGNLTIVVDDKQEISFNARHYNYLDYGYAITTMKSQGMSADNVLAYMDAKAQNFNSFYVTATRAINSLNIWTNDKEALKDKIKVLDIKENATTYLEQRQQHKKQKIDAFREKSKTKNEKLTSKAKKITSTLFLNIDIDKMNKSELTSFIKKHTNDYEKIKKDPLSFLMGINHYKLTRSQTIKLNAELAKQLDNTSDPLTILKIWSSIEKSEPLSIKSKEAIMSKFYDHFKMKHDRTPQKLKEKGLAFFEKNDQTTTFVQLIDETINLKKTFETQKNKMAAIKKKAKDSQFTDMSSILKGNINNFDEYDLKSINNYVKNVKIQQENKDKHLGKMKKKIIVKDRS